MKNLQILRKNAKLTQRELANKVNIPKTNIGHYEIGITQPSIENLCKLADFFGCSVDYLLGHQTNDLVYLSGLSDVQKEMIEEVKQMTDDDLYILKGVLLRLKQEKENPWLKRN